MIGPIRSLYAFAQRAPMGLLASAAAVTVMFSATPFLVPEIADRYHVSEGSVGLISMVQVSSFAAANFLLPRARIGRQRVFRWAGVVFLAANLMSVALSVFWTLMLVRAFAGTAAGALTWVAWGEAMRRPRSMADVAAAGPITALVAAPVMGLLAGAGDRVMYLVLALASVPVLFLEADLSPVERSDRRVSRSRSNRLLLVALGSLTFFGSSLFVFAAVVGRDRFGLSAPVASLAFSLNAGAGFLGARWAARHRRPGVWLMSAGLAAGLVVLGGNAVWYFLGLTYWGFAYWMGVPGVLQMLTDRSLEPAERAGDAQGVMAVGRSLGPLLGGFAFDSGAVAGLAVVAGTGIAAAGATVVGVQEGRHRLPPTPLE